MAKNENNQAIVSPLSVCPICDEEHYVETLFIENSLNMIKCHKCEIVYVHPQPSKKDLIKTYNEIDGFNTNSPESYPQGLKGYSDLEYAHILKANIRSKIVHKHKKTGKVLEIGCSAGYFLKAMKDMHYRTHGVEISKPAVRLGRKKFDLNVFCGDLTEAKFSKEEFDIVTLFNVLSHLKSPIKELKEINRVLSVGGILVIETGNKGEFRSKEKVTKWGDKWGPEEHLFHYSRKALQNLLRKMGFEVLEVKVYPVILSSSLQALRRKVFNFMRKGRVSSTRHFVASYNSTYLMKLFGILSVFFKYKFGKILLGLHVNSTMIFVCRKRAP